MRPLASLREFETFAVGLDHPEGLAFDGEATLFADSQLGGICDSHTRACITAEPGGSCLELTFSPTQDRCIRALGDIYMVVPEAGVRASLGVQCEKVRVRKDTGARARA